MSNPLPTPELLAQQAEWLQRLARRLVVDENDAEELAQDTFAIALSRPPRSTERLRGWLARVMRNRLSERGRAGTARVARERHVAAPEEAQGTDQLVERIQLQRRIADLLLALPEATRTALVLRYYEDLPPRTIAARQGVPLATVKSRLARGLRTLRSNLDEDHGGDRAAWAGVLLPWIGSTPSITAATAAGSLLMKTKLVAGAAVIAVVGAIYWTHPDDQGSMLEDASRVATQPSSSSSDAPSSDGRDVKTAGERSLAGTSTPILPREALPTFVIRGLVLDATGAPLGGLRVRLRGTEDTTVSSAGGSFELSTKEVAGRLEVADAEWIEVRTASWRAEGSIEPVIVAARAIRVSGTVVDEWGRRVDDARLTLEPPLDFSTRFEERLDSSIQEEWSTLSAAHGAFTFARIPALPGAMLRAVRSGYLPHARPAPQQSLDGLWVELQSPRLGQGSALEGRVLRADGDPAVDAIVALGDAVTNADELGRFELELDPTGDASLLIAAEPGSLPAELERPDEPTSEWSGWPELVELRLGGEPLSIEGRVVGADGEPRSRGYVWIAEGTRLARVGAVPIQTEAFLAGGRIPDSALDSLASIASDTFSGDYGTATPALEPDAVLSWVETDANGRFTLTGLRDRDYVLNVADASLHWGIQSQPIAAGSRGVRIEIPADGTLPEVRGRILSEQGDPVPNVAITPWIAAFSSAESFSGGQSDILRFFLGEAVKTDEEGRFVLRDVPRRELQFHAISDDMVPTYFSIEDVDDPLDFTLTVAARAHVEVVLSAGQATSIRVVGKDDAPLQLLQMRADGYSTFASLPIVAGRSGIVTVTTDSEALLLMEDEEVVERVPLRLRPGVIETISR